jgi:hypothetical protein
MVRFLVLLCSLAIASASAEAGAQEKQIKTSQGIDGNLAILVQVNSDCTPGPIPELRIDVAPANGWLIVKNGLIHLPDSAPNCKGAAVPANAIFYRSKPGFSGEDHVSVEVTFAGAPARTENYSISVAPKP